MSAICFAAHQLSNFIFVIPLTETVLQLSFKGQHAMTTSDDFQSVEGFLIKSQQHQFLRNAIMNVEFDLKLKPHDPELIDQLEGLKKELALLDVEVNTLTQGFA
jgi:hypothetical protein